jgi:hypothetical protein
MMIDNSNLREKGTIVTSGLTLVLHDIRLLLLQLAHQVLH